MELTSKQSKTIYLLAFIGILVQLYFVVIDLRLFPFSSHTVAKYHFIVTDHDFYRLARRVDGEDVLVYDRILFKNHHAMLRLSREGVPPEQWREHLLDDFDSIWKINIQREGSGVKVTKTKIYDTEEAL